jgi:nitrile hydratase
MSYTNHADLGGKALPGSIVAEPEGELFHADWEARVLALTLAMGATGEWNIDISRSVRETLPDYASLSYYEIWFEGLLKLLAERGLVLADEASEGQALHSHRGLQRVLRADAVSAVLARGAPTERSVTRSARFAPGERVRLRAAAAPHHTRLPGYARGRKGMVERLHGMHVFADSHSQRQGEAPEWLYTVVFEGAELWGEAQATLRVSIDAWEPYLEADE